MSEQGLLMSRAQATEALLKRIEKGYELRLISIHTKAEYEAAKRNYDSWNRYNIELLSCQFSTQAIAEEYDREDKPIKTLAINETLRAKISYFYNGVDEKLNRINSIIDRLEIIPVLPQLASEKKSVLTRDMTKILIAHGHLEVPKLHVARFIEKLGFEAIILHEQVSRNKTLIEMLEFYSNVGFGVAIYSPCDVGAQRGEEDQLMGRARQNVVFEHGYLIGKLGRENVLPLITGSVEIPSDVSGIVYTDMDKEDWRSILAKELNAAGYEFDMNKALL